MVQIELSSGSCLDVSERHQQNQLQPQRLQQRPENSLDLASVLFGKCGDTNNMACLPQAAFAVHKLRKQQNEKDLAVARLTTDKQDVPRYMNNQTLDLTPVNYSDKFMNSIWGLYNRYSPHNFKKNNGSVQQYFGMQQPFAVACAASEESNSDAKQNPMK
ncbi:uncharacterized protein LOC129767897 [Toxorhynchites rutilus septentrionalis]|uniref:uncharacterized protein LOC129767897 n=1 Tax=Toxorhynchites rutilus septentrionalis TaxID=329112 RepID=UPI00247A3D64|nr:uncharacterized protein LOC129767897 [Toxorhynchites rutilus septentrionalis]